MQFNHSTTARKTKTSIPFHMRATPSAKSIAITFGGHPFLLFIELLHLALSFPRTHFHLERVSTDDKNRGCSYETRSLHEQISKNFNCLTKD